MRLQSHTRISNLIGYSGAITSMNKILETIDIPYVDCQTLLSLLSGYSNRS